MSRLTESILLRLLFAALRTARAYSSLERALSLVSLTESRSRWDTTPRLKSSS